LPYKKFRTNFPCFNQNHSYDVRSNGTLSINHEEFIDIIMNSKVFKCINGEFDGTYYSRLKATWNDEYLNHFLCEKCKNTTRCPVLTFANPIY
jgi:hypothetical protein